MSEYEAQKEKYGTTTDYGAGLLHLGRGAALCGRKIHRAVPYVRRPRFTQPIVGCVGCMMEARRLETGTSVID